MSIIGNNTDFIKQYDCDIETIKEFINDINDRLNRIVEIFRTITNKLNTDIRLDKFWCSLNSESNTWILNVEGNVGCRPFIIYKTSQTGIDFDFDYDIVHPLNNAIQFILSDFYKGVDIELINNLNQEERELFKETVLGEEDTDFLDSEIFPGFPYVDLYEEVEEQYESNIICN